MKQSPLFLDSRCKYIVKHKGREQTAWLMAGIWHLSNYSIVDDVEVIERLGTASEVFG